MRDFTDHRKTYYTRMLAFMEYMKAENPNWVKEKAWFVDLNSFELGENFYEKILQAENKSSKDTKKFALLVEQAKKAMNSEVTFTKAELGFVIDEDITDPKEQKEHESILGYIWWYHIYWNATNARTLGSQQVKELAKRQEEFLKALRKIESLSSSTILQ